MKKNLNLAFLALVFTVLLLPACKKGDAGPQGQTGPQGSEGPQGVEGNADVTLYSFGPQSLATAAYTMFSIATTEDSANNSAWFVYLYYDANSRWYSIPGFGIGGATDYRLSNSYASGQALIYIDKASGTGENYSKAKVFRIYGTHIVRSTTAAAPVEMKPLPDIDFSNYEAVNSYYHLAK
jgi:hypothetical protein